MSRGTNQRSQKRVSEPVQGRAGKGQPWCLPGGRRSLPTKPHKATYPTFHQANSLILTEDSE